MAKGLLLLVFLLAFALAGGTASAEGAPLPCLAQLQRELEEEGVAVLDAGSSVFLAETGARVFSGRLPIPEGGIKLRGTNAVESFEFLVFAGWYVNARNWAQPVWAGPVTQIKQADIFACRRVDELAAEELLGTTSRAAWSSGAGEMVIRGVREYQPRFRILEYYSDYYKYYSSPEERNRAAEADGPYVVALSLVGGGQEERWVSDEGYCVILREWGKFEDFPDVAHWHLRCATRQDVGKTVILSYEERGWGRLGKLVVK